MYVSPTSTRLLSGMLMPAIRAIRLPLTLLVTRVLADHEHGAVAADDLALLAHGLDRRSDLHAPRITFIYVRTGAKPRSRRCATSPGKIAAGIRPAGGRQRRHAGPSRPPRGARA